MDLCTTSSGGVWSMRSRYANRVLGVLLPLKGSLLVGRLMSQTSHVCRLWQGSDGRDSCPHGMAGVETHHCGAAPGQQIQPSPTVLHPPLHRVQVAAHSPRLASTGFTQRALRRRHARSGLAVHCLREHLACLSSTVGVFVRPLVISGLLSRHKAPERHRGDRVSCVPWRLICMKKWMPQEKYSSSQRHLSGGADTQQGPMMLLTCT
jgi:hypothetical protein